MFFEHVEASCISDESMPWMPLGLAPGVEVKFFKADPIRGEVIALLKAPADAKLPRHHHSGTVVVYTLKGKWKYKEHDWIAGPGSIVYETAASTHAPEAVPEGGPEVVVLNIVTGDLVYLNDDDSVMATANWRTAAKQYFGYCKKNGIEPRDITAFGYPVADPAEMIAVLQYTGGTTGLPKGAMLTHANLTSTCQQYRATTAGSPPVLAEGRERFLAVLPPFHIYALAVNVLFAILQGAEIIQHVRFDPRAALEDISGKGVSVFCGVPTMFTALINHPETPKHSLRTLKYCGSGGAPLPLEVAQQFAAITGCNLTEGWGMTETSPAGTFTPAQKDGIRKAGSCGMPMPGIVIKFLSVDNPEQYVPLGERGEICIKGPNVMKGYWNNPQATADMTTFDGFLRTGDVGYMDQDGFVFIVDRTKDMLLCGGYNVYPRVLEEAIYKHPAVEEVAVIGIHDEYRGQSPKAFIKLKNGAATLTLDKLQKFLKDKLGKHEMVQALEIRDALPKTPVGKISKKDLYDEEERKTAAA
jgi:long-chain acyl-CoA synthetase